METLIWYTPIHKGVFLLSYCPKCEKENHHAYVGVNCNEDHNYKIFKCRNEVCSIFYTIEVKKGEKGKEKEIPIKRDRERLLTYRTSCPLCMGYKHKYKQDTSRTIINDKDIDFEYTGVVYMGGLFDENNMIIKNKFYCNNHSKSFYYQKYQFSINIDERETMTLAQFIKEAKSQYYYTKIRDIHKLTTKKYSIKDNEFLSLYNIGLPQTILAKIFHISQSTINRDIKKSGLAAVDTIYIEKIHKTLFYTKIKVRNSHLEKLKSERKKEFLNP